MPRMIFACLLVLLSGCSKPEPSVEWHLNNLNSIGGNPLTVIGSPKVIDTAYGKAIEFDGVDDGIILNTLPVHGWQSFTAEIIFKPYAGGLHEQRFFHMQVADEKHRLLFETRLTEDNRWYLDTFLRYNHINNTMLAIGDKHPIDEWHHAAITVDGSRFSHYVNGRSELSKEIDFIPLAGGKTALGMRLNQVWWFKGAILKVRLTPKVLSPDEFLTLSN